MIVFHPCKCFWISMLWYVLVATGLTATVSFENEKMIWTPEGNPSAYALTKSREMFPDSDKGGVINALAEVKGDHASLLTIPALTELASYQNQFRDIYSEYNDQTISYNSVCPKVKAAKCVFPKSLAELIDINQFSTDADLVK